jgi:ABC-2 type transport system ATP-binding protein
MIEVNNLSKHFGKKVAVDGISFALAPGKVTGFLGPNGSGKTTTMRCMLGLANPTSGNATFDGVEYVKLANPAAKVGAMIDAKAFHKARSARDHLRTLAAASGVSNKRVDEVLDIVGLTSVAKRKAGGFSLGMGQRIGIAGALLADPEALILDEPVNGLDPDGVKWVRDFCREFAASGRTVLISSHLMSEVEQTADDIIIIGQGKIIKTGTIADITSATTKKSVRIKSIDHSALVAALEGSNFKFKFAEDSVIVLDVDAAQIGDWALRNQIVLTELEAVKDNLEEAYMSLTKQAVEYHAHGLNNGSSGESNENAVGINGGSNESN